MADPYLTDNARGRIHVAHAEGEMRAAVDAAFRRYLTAVEAAVLDRQTSGNVTAADEPDLTLWPGAHVWRRLVTVHIVPTWARLFARAFGRFLRKPQRARLATEDYQRTLLDDATQRLTGATWPDEVYDAVREQIAAGLAAEENRQQLRRRVRQVLGPDQWTGRANTIARTEAMSALVGGSYQAAKARQDVFGERLVKRWVATEDHRTRHAHREADGQTVPFDEPFTVGGEHLQFPHDPRATPGNNVNCRCVLTVHAEDEMPDDEPVTAVSRAPGPLKRYWTRGKGALKIRWGSKNDFYRCRRHLKKYVPNHMVDGLCANLHKRALGVWPGSHTKADAGGCPCEDMTDEQIEEALAPMLDDPETAADLDQHDEDPAAPDTPEPAETSDDTAAEWELPGDDEVDDDDLVVDGETITAAGGDFTKSGGPTARKRHRAEKSRAAMKGGRFPIENTSDLRKAVMALGRAKGGPRGRAAVKAHIIRRAKALGATNLLPESWRSGGKTAAAGGNSWYELVAERVPDHPPAEWFADPELTGPTKIRVSDDGRVFGHIAAWDTEHASLPGVTARMFADDPFHRFHRHPVRTATGERVRTGPLATGGHASTEDPRVDLTAAQAHYDQPEFVAADVVVGKDRHGIWCSGALRPGVSPQQVMLLDRYSISGDWRHGELVAACSVSVPGFHLDDDANVMALAADAGPHRPTLGDHRPRARFDTDGHPFALVAAGVVTSDTSAGKQLDGWQLYREFRAAQDEHEAAERTRLALAAAAASGAAAKVARLRVT